MLTITRSVVTSVLVGIGGFVLMGVVGPTPIARAHAELTTTVPAAGAVLAATPPTATLTFTDPIDQQFVRTAVTGPSTTVTVAGTATGRSVSVPIPDQGGGAYTVTYRVVSADGHPVSGSLRFTVTGRTTASSTAPLLSASSSSATTGAMPGASAVAVTADAPDSGGGTSRALIGAVIAGVLLVAGGAVALFRGRTRRQ